MDRRKIKMIFRFDRSKGNITWSEDEKVFVFLRAKQRRPTSFPRGYQHQKKSEQLYGIIIAA
jgi:hypothetical protein